MKTQHPHKSTTTPEKFIHVKEGLNPKFQAVTIFARPDETGRWWASAAICVKQDSFCRKTGRTIARRHFFDGKHQKIFVGKISKIHNIVASVLLHHHCNLLDEALKP